MYDSFILFTGEDNTITEYIFVGWQKLLKNIVQGKITFPNFEATTKTYSQLRSVKNLNDYVFLFKPPLQLISLDL